MNWLEKLKNIIPKGKAVSEDTEEVENSAFLGQGQDEGNPEDAETDLEKKRRRKLVALSFFGLLAVAAIYLSTGEDREIKKVAVVDGVKPSVVVEKPGLPPSMEYEELIDASAVQEIKSNDARHKEDMRKLREDFSSELERKLSSVNVAKPPKVGDVTQTNAPRTSYYPPAGYSSPPSSGNYQGTQDLAPPAVQRGVSYRVVQAVPFSFKEPVVSRKKAAAVAPKGSGVSTRSQLSDYGSDAVNDTYIPSGSFVEGVILNGADVPAPFTGAGEKYPFLITLTSDSFGPHKTSKPLRECTVIASGQGILSTERIKARTERISCEFEDGSTLDTKFQAYLVDTDGRVGLRGKLETRNGAQLAMLFGSGFFQGMGTTVSGLAQGSSVTGLATGLVTQQAPTGSSMLQAATAGGLGEGFKGISEYYTKWLSSIFPVISVPAMREVTLVVIQGIEMAPNVHPSKKEGEK